MTSVRARLRRPVTWAACAWAILFGLPHLLWALGIPAGFPGGEASYHRFMSSGWRYAYDVLVVLLSLAGAAVAIRLLRPPNKIAGIWIPRVLAWIASAALTVRGVAGMIVDGRSDPVWWPTFLIGGILFGAAAWLTRAGGATSPTAAPYSPSPRR